jgi:hypothetical protein
VGINENFSLNFSLTPMQYNPKRGHSGFAAHILYTSGPTHAVLQLSVSQPPGRGPVPGPRLVREEFTGPRSHKG